VTIVVDSLIAPEILKPARYLGNELGAAHKQVYPTAKSVNWRIFGV
jgi:heme oxygenase